MIIDAKICPFCKKVNKCMPQNQHACWCNNVEIPEQLINRVPERLKRKTCICLACIALFNETPILFESEYLSKD